jgi:hypothetical protein
MASPFLLWRIAGFATLCFERLAETYSMARLMSNKRGDYQRVHWLLYIFICPRNNGQKTF